LNWGTLLSNPWVVTIGGGLGVVFVVWLWKRFFKNSRAGESTKGTVQQNASPVMTQNFQPTINIHPVVADAAKGRVSVKVEELWKRLTVLKDAFWALPNAGYVIGPSDAGSRLDASTEFVRQYCATAQFLREEMPSIPKAIAEEAGALLRIAEDEAIRARLFPDPFAGVALDQRALTDFLERRSSNLKNFNAGVDNLQNTMRAFIEGNG
jgi:hypothetical protein